MTSASTARTVQWESQPLAHLVTLAWPIVISMLSYSTMTLVDTLFVGRLGQHALAGVGLGGISGFLLICFPMGMLGAVKILVSQAIGAGRLQRLPAFLGAGLWLGVGIGILIMGIGQALSLTLPYMTATPPSGEVARDYLAIRVLGAPAYLARIAIEQARIGCGDSKSPMKVAVAANLSNVALDYLFIFELGQGAKGAAVATAVSNVVGLILMMAIQRREGFGLAATSVRDIRSVLRLGIPTGLQFSLEVGGYGAMVAILANISDLDAAANQIAIQVLHFGFLPCVAFGEAASVMAGQAVGANRRGLVQQVAAQSMIPTTAYTLLCSVTFVLAGPFIARSFTPDVQVIALTTKLLYLAALFQLADGANIVARGILKGTGDVRYTAWAGIGLTWALTPPLTWFLGHNAGLGAVGGWIGLCIEIFLGMVVFWLRLRSTRWYAAADRTIAEIRASA